MQMQGSEAVWQPVLDAHLHRVYPGLLITSTGNTAIVVCLTSGARRTLPPRLERLGTRAIGAAGVTDSGGTLVDACTGSFYNVVRPQRTVKNTAIVVC